MRLNQVRKLLHYDINTGIFTSTKSKTILGKLGSDGYLYIWIDGRKYKADEMAWFITTGIWPKKPIVHVDGVNLNNWISNLELENKTIPQKNNISTVTGVSWDKRDERWRASISYKKKQMSLGNYRTLDEAVVARFKAEKIHGVHRDNSAQSYVNKMFF